ncbi:Nicotinamide/nicotinic acid mononucleotide adenylyltransferase 1 [Dispira simplex]|nr:Nicotinamide/nicotinic acid mononucleotide adenylyltransferase 1 [Dispira simplex]
MSTLESSPNSTKVTHVLSHTVPSMLGVTTENLPDSYIVTTLTATTTIANLPNTHPYAFPVHRLPTQLRDESKTPLVLVACGSFSPVTYLHLRMFEMVMDYYTEHNSEYELVAGYFSPVNDCYRKQGLAAAHHRVTMCQLATETTSSWVMVDPWESLQPIYQRTAVVLDHFHQELNLTRGGITLSDGSKKPYKIMLLAGGDLIQSFGDLNIWADQDLHRILGQYGCTIIERTGTDVYDFLLSHDILYEHRKHVHVVKQLIYNDISSTKVRLFIKRRMSIKYLLPDPVIRYIEEQKLYQE